MVMNFYDLRPLQSALQAPAVRSLRRHDPAARPRSRSHEPDRAVHRQADGPARPRRSRTRTRGGTTYSDGDEMKDFLKKAFPYLTIAASAVPGGNVATTMLGKILNLKDGATLDDAGLAAMN